jgi:hypothetical protein
MLEILRAHRARYPQMEPRDAVKLLYQRAFGSGHRVAGREDALARLREEMQTVRPAPGTPLFEGIGADFARMQLASPLLPPLSTVVGMFVASARLPSQNCFQEDLDRLVAHWPQCSAFVATYRAQGCPPLSHSAAYRAAYAPAYRVVLSQYERFLDAFRHIDALSQRPRLLIAIDGRCGAGKSSLARLIAPVYGATVLHMDDFFLTEAQKASGVPAPVANIDGQRLMAALQPLAAGEPFEYRPYDCISGEFHPVKRVSPARVAIVEGSYCLHPSIRIPYDVKIFLTIDPQTQKARLAVRNPDLFDQFCARWIPQEEAYFKAHDIQAGCLTLDGGNLDGRDACVRREEGVDS